jgi:hypothetical protein
MCLTPVLPPSRLQYPEWTHDNVEQPNSYCPSEVDMKYIQFLSRPTTELSLPLQIPHLPFKKIRACRLVKPILLANLLDRTLDQP